MEICFVIIVVKVAANIRNNEIAMPAVERY